jgi:hypothetical protein
LGRKRKGENKENGKREKKKKRILIKEILREKNIMK